MKKKGTTSAKAKRQNRKQRQHKVIKIVLAGMLLISTGHEIYKAETEKINTEYQKEMNAANQATESLGGVTWEAGAVVNFGGTQGEHVAGSTNGGLVRIEDLEGGTTTYANAAEVAQGTYLSARLKRSGLTGALPTQSSDLAGTQESLAKFRNRDSPFWSGEKMKDGTRGVMTIDTGYLSYTVNVIKANKTTRQCNVTTPTKYAGAQETDRTVKTDEVPATYKPQRTVTATRGYKRIGALQSWNNVGSYLLDKAAGGGESGCNYGHGKYYTRVTLKRGLSVQPLKEDSTRTTRYRYTPKSILVESHLMHIQRSWLRSLP